MHGWEEPENEQDVSLMETTAISEKAHQWIIKQCKTNAQLDAVMGCLFQQHIKFQTIWELLHQGFISVDGKGETK
jgi:hypothetical protein